MKIGNVELNPLNKKPHERTQIENDYIALRAREEIARLVSKHDKSPEFMGIMAQALVKEAQSRRPASQSQDSHYD